ncbi:MAG: cellulase family glycosylhydrolase [Flavobacteriales bacterium]|nr:cellulase family glycosylhydrolase [Flavobacteriales bacterium]
MMKVVLNEILQEFGDRFNVHPALMAYDLYNEPAYFDYTDHTKQWICEKVASVYDELKAADPNHLITVGGISVVEVFEWDPTILKLDFWSPHLYPIFQTPRHHLRQAWTISKASSPGCRTIWDRLDDRRLASWRTMRRTRTSCTERKPNKPHSRRRCCK